jgi:hypothetical protein
VLAGGSAKAESGGTLSLTGNLGNRGDVKALGGTVTATGTLLTATDATGDFSATGSQMNLSGATFQTGVRNTFTANSGGTITLPSGLATADLWVTDALRLRGGILTVPNGTTLTHGAGKTIAGYGQLLETGRTLANLGTVRADGGTLTVAGATASSNALLAVTGETTIYCYGLSIRQDASLGLGGRTLYYLRDGVEYNGIRGTGFLQEGTYKNGNIIEVVPEPATGTIIAVLVATTMLGRRRTSAVRPRRER